MDLVELKNKYLGVLNSISSYSGEENDLLIELIQVLRPRNGNQHQQINHRFELLIGILAENRDINAHFKDYLFRILNNKNYHTVLSDSNIVLETGFWGELIERIVHKILPNKQEKDFIEDVINDVFHKDTDIKWIKNITQKNLIEFLNVLEISGMHEMELYHPFLKDIIYSTDVIMQRLTGKAFDANVLKLAPEYKKLNNPFTRLQNELGIYLSSINSNKITRSIEEPLYKKVELLFYDCNQFIAKAYNNIGTYGISFKAHQHLTLIEQLLLRLETVLNFLVIDHKINSKKKLINIFYNILEFETGKNKIREYISKSTQNIAREITESTGSKGESYITLTKKEYISMLKSAIGGGFLVAFACFIKMNMGSVSTSLFGKAFMYSINYIWVFTSIYLLNFTLATKQPAMTASTLAKAIESGLVKDDNFQGLTILISRIWRTQFIAFVGNVFMASFTALGIMFAWQYLFNTNPAEKKAYTLINDLNFVYSPLIFHAAIAGFFLFISGVISGYTTKRTKFNNLVGRIQNHPILKQICSYNTRMNIADYLNKHIAGIVSNFWFGIFMGSTVVVGMFLGLNLDIRHITFAAGNFMLAFFGQNFTTTSYDILMSILGIGIIGFINFIVSFTLSLLLALRSRGIEFNSLKLILSSSLSYFFKNPMSFFFPVEKLDQHKIN